MLYVHVGCGALDRKELKLYEGSKYSILTFLCYTEIIIRGILGAGPGFVFLPAALF